MLKENRTWESKELRPTGNNCQHCQRPIRARNRGMSATGLKYCGGRCAAHGRQGARPTSVSPDIPTTPYRLQKNPPRARKSYDQRTLEESRRGDVPLHALGLAEVMGSVGPRICRNCDYKKHVELAHIKPVHSFPKTAKLIEVNATKNLMWLCPNCHWEYDHLDLGLDEIAG